MAEQLRVKILEDSQVFPSPPPSLPPCPYPNSFGAEADTHAAYSLIPLTFFDLPWLFFPPAQPLFFFPYPYPITHFLSSTLPSLKHSLSLTLRHFFPFAGRLVLKCNSTPTPDHGHCHCHCQPKIVFNQNDCYVSVTFAESNADFHHISGNHPRNVRDFQPLVPYLKSCSSLRCNSKFSGNEEANDAVSLLAVKVTVFPNYGLCIGLAYHHVAGDGRTFDNFIKTWASFHEDSTSSINSKPMPCYDRTAVIDKHGLEPIFLNEWRKKKMLCATQHHHHHHRELEHEMVFTGSQSKFRRRESESSDTVVAATFVIALKDVDRMKRWIVGECKKKNVSEPIHLSPYVVLCSFVWVCLIKTLSPTPTPTPTPTPSQNDDDDDDDEDAHEHDDEHPSYFGFNAGGVHRFDYPVPASYIGNCIGFGRCEAARRDLKGEDGIIIAAKAIGDTVKKLDRSLLGEAQRWISEWEVFFGSEPHIMAVGSPKLELYDTDFGWGRPNKIENISIHGGKGKAAVSFSLTESRDEKGGFEVGLALSHSDMALFTSLFKRMSSP